MSDAFQFALDEEVTFSKPGRKSPIDGVIVMRRSVGHRGIDLHRYTILDERGTAHTYIPPAWIEKRGQVALPV